MSVDHAHEHAPGMGAPLLGTGRGRTLIAAGVAVLVLGAVFVTAAAIPDQALATNLGARSRPPGPLAPFGTDPLGRDMFARTIRGLAVSLQVGLVAAALAALVATALGIIAALDHRADRAVGWLVDLVMGLPHLVLLILISFMLGGGTTGIIVAVTLTHWPGLARIVRAEVMQILASDYVAVSRRFGRSRLFIATRHVVPHLVPQVLVGAVLLFPHAILHEAGLSFLGFGFEPHLPATGILLAESMRHVTAGLWWLALMPGASLLIVVLMFEWLASGLRLITDSHRAQD